VNQAVPGDDLEEQVNNEVKLCHFLQDTLTSGGQEVRQQTADELDTSDILVTYHA